MIKFELIDFIAARNRHLYRQDVERIVDTVLDDMAGALERGERVELRGFGAFFVRHRPARTGRNPKTGDKVSIPEKWVPLFRAGKEIRNRLNGGDGALSARPRKDLDDN